MHCRHLKESILVHCKMKFNLLFSWGFFLNFSHCFIQFMMSWFSDVNGLESKFQGLCKGAETKMKWLFLPISESSKSSRFILTTRKSNCSKRKLEFAFFKLQTNMKEIVLWAHEMFVSRHKICFLKIWKDVKLF